MLNSKPPFQPQWASAPGTTITDCLERQHLPLREFADRIGISLSTAQRLLKGQIPIDQEFARRLHATVGGSPTFWLNREAEYRTDLRRLHVDLDPEASKEWLQQLPVRDMIKLGWIQAASDKRAQTAECLQFFDVPNIDTWHKNYHALAKVVSFRTSSTLVSNAGSVSAWLRQGELEAASIDCQPWNREKFRRSLAEVRRLTRRKNPEQFLPELQQQCSKFGVAVVVVRAPAGCRASGATRFLSREKAMLLLSFRYRTDDHFWFTFFHEAARRFVVFSHAAEYTAHRTAN